MRIERFTVDVVDEEGKPLQLHGVRRFQSYRTLSEGDLEGKGTAELFEPNGDPVNEGDNGTFVGLLSRKRYTPR